VCALPRGKKNQGAGKKTMERKREKKPVAETFECLMQDLGIRDEVYKAAIKRVRAWQLEEAARNEAQ
jgi:hypothetical protein